MAKNTDKHTTGTFFARKRFALSIPGGESAHYANAHSLSLSDSLQEITTKIAEQTFLQPLPSKSKQYIKDTHVVENANDQQTKYPVRRTQFGTQQAARSMVLVQVLLNIYSKYGNNHFHKDMRERLQRMPYRSEKEKYNYFIKLLQITAFYLEAGRHHNGKRKRAWLEAASADCQIFIMRMLITDKVPDEQAKETAQFFASLITLQNAGNEKKVQSNVFARLLSDVTTLEQMHLSNSSDFLQNAFSRHLLHPSTRHFRIDTLNLWKDAIGRYDNALKTFSDESSRAYLQDDLIRLSLEWQRYVNEGCDLATATPIEIVLGKSKMVINHGITPRRDPVKKSRFEYAGYEAALEAANSAKFPFMAAELSDANSGNKNIVQHLTRFNNYSALRISYINLDYQLLFFVDADAAEKIRKLMRDLSRVLVSPKESRETKQQKLNEFIRETAGYRKHFSDNAYAALVFLIVAAVAAILGVAIVLAVTMFSGGLPVGFDVGLMDVAKIFVETTKGHIIGGMIAISALATGLVSGKVTQLNGKNRFFSDCIESVITEAKEVIRVTKS